MKRHPTLTRVTCVAGVVLSAGFARADEAVQSAKAVLIAGHPVAGRTVLKALQDGGNAIDTLDKEIGALGRDVQRRTEKDYDFGSVDAVRWKPDGTLVGVADQRRTSDAAAE